MSATHLYRHGYCNDVVAVVIFATVSLQPHHRARSRRRVHHSRRLVLGRLPLQRRETSLFFSKFDPDNSGTITYEEFVRYVYGSA